MSTILIQKPPQKLKVALIQPKEENFVPNGQMPLTNLTKTLRIQINTSTRGYVDGRQSTLEVTVAAPQNMFVGGLVLDTCAENLIQNWVLRYKGNQIQRFTGQHRVGTIFHQMGKMGKQQIQHGKMQAWNLNKCPSFNSTPSTPVMSYNGSITTPTPTTGGWFGGNVTTTGYLPTQFVPNLMSSGQMVDSAQSPSIQQYQKGTIGHLSSSNPVYSSVSYTSYAYNKDATPPAWGLIKYPSAFCLSFNSMKNIRSQYVSANKKGIQSTTSLNSACMGLDQKVTSLAYPWQLDQKTYYNIYYPPNRNVLSVQGDIMNKYSPNVVNNTTSKTGYSKPFDQALYARDPPIILSQTIPSIDIANGTFLQHPIPLKQHTFSVSIPSSVFGIYAPEHQYSRYPMQFLHNCTMQITFNKNAFYSTGYSDISQYDAKGMSTAIPRTYIVKNIELNLKWYDYQIPDLYRKKTLTDKFFIQTDIWQTLTTTIISNPSQINGVRQLTLPYTQVSELIVAFYSTDYLNFPFCRQNFRLSYNVTSIQVKYAGKYYPSTPYEGHGGNPYGSINNSQYLLNLTHSKLYDPQYCRINKRNFAVNQRPYNVKNQTTLYDMNTLNCQTIGTVNSIAPIYSSQINADTAMGQSAFHEQRCKGQALYVIPFNNEVIMGEQITSSGLNITSGQTLQLWIQTDEQTNYAGPVQMVVIGCFRKKIQRNFKTDKIQMIQVI